MTNPFIELDDILAELRQDFLVRLDAADHLLRAARDALAASGAEAAAQRGQIGHEAHKLAGLGRTMGYDAISTEAFALEAESMREEGAPAALLERIDRLCDEIARVRAK